MLGGCVIEGQPWALRHFYGVGWLSGLVHLGGFEIEIALDILGFRLTGFLYGAIVILLICTCLK